MDVRPKPARRRRETGESSSIGKGGGEEKGKESDMMNLAASSCRNFLFFELDEGRRRRTKGDGKDK